MARLIAALLALAACAASAQLPDGQRLVRAALDDTLVYEVAATGSMKPAFDENYLLCVKMLPFEMISVGDVIIYELDVPIWDAPYLIKLICHRVYRKSSGNSIVICQGDANPWPDKIFITKSMYRGTVVGVIKKL